jgi:hypothetical protein
VRKFHHTQIGNGSVYLADDILRLTVPSVNSAAYHDAQITDYTLPQRDFFWEPLTNHTVHLEVEAQFNRTDIRGTAGFGFWNHPFSPDMSGLPRPPQAAWFFYGSPPNNMPLAQGVPGYGWKAATISARRWSFWSLAPFAPLGLLLMRVPTLYNVLWPIGQNAIAVREQLLEPQILLERTRYAITWAEDAVSFAVNGVEVLRSPFRLRGRMGFIAWIDNQYAIVTPQGRFGWGLVDVPHTQSLTLYRVEIG